MARNIITSTSWCAVLAAAPSATPSAAECTTSPTVAVTPCSLPPPIIRLSASEAVQNIKLETTVQMILKALTNSIISLSLVDGLRAPLYIINVITYNPLGYSYLHQETVVLPVLKSDRLG